MCIYIYIYTYIYIYIYTYTTPWARPDLLRIPPLKSPFVQGGSRGKGNLFESASMGIPAGGKEKHRARGEEDV